MKGKIIIMVILISASSELGFIPLEHEHFAFKFMTMDSVELEVYYDYDSSGTWVGYYSHIKTPVCEDQLCFDAELDFYWDLLGNFSRFNLLEDKPLTKQDHVPFDDADYVKLRNILLTKSPAFIHLRRSELITRPEHTDLSDIDANTGATAREVKKDMVPGAVYTCYTLWHIANGGIEFRIKEHTKQKLDRDVIQQILNSKQVEAHYYLVENMDSEYFKEFLSDFMALAQRYDPYFTGRLMDRFPQNLWSNTQVQEFFLRHFQNLEYTAQDKLLLKLQNNVLLSESALDQLIENFHGSNIVRNDQIIKIMCNNANEDNIPALKEMISMINDRQIIFSQASHELLISLGGQFRELKKPIKQLKQNGK